MFQRSAPPERFLGPWSLFEILSEEFAELRPPAVGSPRISTVPDPQHKGHGAAAPWSVTSDDIRDPVRTARRLVELRFQRELAMCIVRKHQTVVEQAGTRVSGWFSIPASESYIAHVTRIESDLREQPPEYTFNHALELDPAILAGLCSPLMQSNRGKALAQNAPDIGSLAESDRVETRCRFNREVLEAAFAGYIRAVDDRECARLFTAMVAEENAAPAGSDRGYLWALSLSGGGIRSASFSLGVLQALARVGYLDRFDYLSTVSGGGYIGSWLSAWIAREGKAPALAKLATHSGDPLSPEAAPVRHLRLYSRYLSPHRGAFTADLWTLIATMLRNMLLNWMMILPFVAAVMITPFLAASVAGHPPGRPQTIRYLIMSLMTLAFGCAVTGVWFVHAHRPSASHPDEDATNDSMRALARLLKHSSERAFLAYCLLPLSIAAAVLNTLLYWLDVSPAIQREFPIMRASRSLPILGDVPMGAVMLGAFGLAAHVIGAAIADRSGPTESHRGKHTISGAVNVVLSGVVAGSAAYGIARAIHAASTWSHPFVSPALEGYMRAVQATPEAIVYSILAFPAFILTLALASFLYIGLSGPNRSDEEREWSARYTAWLLMAAVAWLLLAGIVAGSGWVLNNGLQRMISGFGIGLGGITALLGNSPFSGGKASATTSVSESGKVRAIFSRFGIALLAPIALLLIMMTVATLDVGLLQRAGTFDIWPPAIVLAVAAMLLSTAYVVSRRVDVNKFSLHAMYRARLIRAYLGASRLGGARHANPFTGFDPDDNMSMSAVLGDTPRSRPIHIINAALNLAGGSGLGWQDRQARSFTISPLHAGAAGMGYRRTKPKISPDETYAGARGGISLGTAMAISGAAASPNMGYHSSKPVTFLMTIFNARLGWWLGNTGWPGHDNFHDASPNVRVLSPIFPEMLGLTRDSDPLIYLSDGGHFENLGLYEMVLRRCRLIVVVDASADVNYRFDDLGNAIAKIRIDMGIPIEFDSPNEIRSRDDKGNLQPAGTHGMTARVCYSTIDPGADDGLLVYIKPALNGDEPADVLAYSRSSPTFPHESTAEQFFTELQLESYRALGDHSARRVLDVVSERISAQMRAGERFFKS